MHLLILSVDIFFCTDNWKWSLRNYKETPSLATEYPDHCFWKQKCMDWDSSLLAVHSQNSLVYLCFQMMMTKNKLSWNLWKWLDDALRDIWSKFPSQFIKVTWIQVTVYTVTHHTSHYSNNRIPITNQHLQKTSKPQCVFNSYSHFSSIQLEPLSPFC